MISSINMERALPFGLSRPAPASRATAAAVPQDNSNETVLLRLYDSYVNEVYKFIFNKVRSREDAEDLTSQVFLKATQTLDTSRDERSMLAWLYQVARTTISDHWRAHYRSVDLSLEELAEEQAVQFAAQPAPIAAEEVTPAQVQVDALLAALPANYRRVLELRFLHGYSLKETAAAMNITEGNVKILQFRALQKAGKLPLDAPR